MPPHLHRPEEPSTVSRMLKLLICSLMLQLAHATCDRCTVSTNKTWIQKEIVDVHNRYRRLVQPPASDMLQMSYSTELAATAQAWVDNCTLGHGPPSSRMLRGYEVGENLFYSNSPYPWSQVIAAWHSEVAHYQYPNISTNGQKIGHYTQVVWNTSYKVGCGVRNCNGTYLYGCHYYRAGNFVGCPPYKVGNHCGSCNSSCVQQLCTNPCPYVNPFSNCPTLAERLGCNNTVARLTCFASCNCTDKIIPIG